MISSFSQLCTVILHFGDEKWTLKPYASSYCKQTGIKFLIQKEMFCRAQELASLSQTFLRFEYMYITMSPNLFSFRVLFFQHHFECFSWQFTLRDRGICVSDLKIINVLRFGVATQEAASDSKQEPWAPAQNQSVVYYIFVAWLDFFLLRIIFIPFRVTFFRQSEFDT